MMSDQIMQVLNDRTQKKEEADELNISNMFDPEEPVAIAAQETTLPKLEVNPEVKEEKKPKKAAFKLEMPEDNSD